MSWNLTFQSFEDKKQLPVPAWVGSAMLATATFFTQQLGLTARSEYIEEKYYFHHIMSSFYPC